MVLILGFFSSGKPVMSCHLPMQNLWKVKKNLKNNTFPKICVNNDICLTLSHSSLSYTKYYDFINCY